MPPREPSAQVATPPPSSVATHESEQTGPGFLRRRWFLIVVLVLMGALLAAIVGPLVFDVSGTPKRFKPDSPRKFSESEHTSPGHYESDSVRAFFNSAKKAEKDGDDPDEGPSSQEHDPNATGY